MNRKTLPIIAAVQMCSSDNVDENLGVAAHYIKEAASTGAEVVVLPEMFAVMDNAVKAAIKESAGSGKIQSFLAECAKDNHIWIVGGTIPIAMTGTDKYSAACLVYDAHGKNVARYDKMHMFDVKLSDDEVYQESAMLVPGDKTVVVDTPVGKLGLAVCFDVRFPDQFKSLVKAGAEVIALPAAFTMKTGNAHWELLMRSRAIDNFCYMVGACQGGCHSTGRKTYGHSMIVEPWGSIIAAKKDEESGIIFAEIDLKKVYEARKIIPVMIY